MNFRLKLPVFKFIVIVFMVLPQITALQLEDEGSTTFSGTVTALETKTEAETSSEPQTTPFETSIEITVNESNETVDSIQVQQPTAEQPLVQQPQAEQPLVQQPTAEKPQVQPKAEQPKVQQPQAEQPQVQPKAEQPEIQQPQTEQPQVQQPTAEQPQVQQPQTEQPKVQQPKAEQPEVQQPQAEQPQVQQPKAEQPQVEQPQVEQSEEQQPQNDTWESYTYLITGGYRPAQQPLAKYLVSISGRDILTYYGDDRICAGAIIAARLILTSAHCVKRIWFKGLFSPGGARVVAGTSHLLWRSSNTQERVALRLIEHPKYSHNNRRYDIAVIVLDRRLEMNDNVQVIPLATEPIQPGTICTVVGWGRVFEYNTHPTKALYAPVQIWPDPLCKAYTKSYIETTICSNNIMDEEVDACEGTTGSPLICGNRLAGISLYGMGCSPTDVPGFYMDVYKYLYWISHYDNRAVGGKTGALTLYVILALAVWRAL